MKLKKRRWARLQAEDIIFLCILTYVGAGYSKKFVKNFDAHVDSIYKARPLRFVEGADQICSACWRYGFGHNAANHSCWSLAMLGWDQRAIDAVNNTLKPSVLGK